MSGASKEIANYLSSATFEGLPGDVVLRMQDLILDHMGVSIFGSTTPWAKMVANLVISEGGKGESTIYLSGSKAPSRSAALANGTMAHGFELDDTLSPFHPGCVVIPAALTIGESSHCSGKELITAVVAGYEVMSRIGSAIHDSKVFRAGHHGTGITGSFGAAAACGKLLKLEEKELIWALGLAANQHTGIMEFFKEGTMEKRLFAGKASHDGVLSAMLAAKGYTAASSSLDGDYGFCRVFDSEADLTMLTKDLGKTFRLMETGIKPYPCCRTIHSQIDCAIKIAQTHNISYRDISEVTVYGSKSQACDQHAYYEVPDVMAAQYGIPYCIAKALMNRKVWVDDFTAKAMSDPETLKFMHLIKVVYDDEIERNKGMAKVSVKVSNGETFTETTLIASGSPETPSFRDDLNNKFRSLGLTVLSAARVDKIMHLVQNLTELGDVSELADAMGPAQ